MVTAIVMIVAIIVGLLVAANTPKPKQPAPKEADSPTQQEGKSFVRHLGTCRVKDPSILAWRVVGRQPIKTKGGKK